MRSLSNQTLVNIALLGLIIIGLGIAMYQAFTLPVIADAVNPGLYAREFWNGNQQYFLPVNDPYFLDYALNIIVGPLTGYSTQSMFISSYLIYMGVVLLAGLIAHKLSGTTSGLIAATLVANAPIAGLKYLTYPVWHGSTLLIILVALYVYMATQDYRRLFLIAALCIFGALADTLMITIFIIPLGILSFIQAYQEFKTTKNRKSVNCHVGFTIALSIITLAIMKGKQGGMSLWPNGLYLTAVGGVDRLLNSSIQVDMFWQYIEGMIRMSGGMMICAILIIGLLTAYKHADTKTRQLYGLTIFSAIVMFAGFLVMTSTGGDQGRYIYLIPILGLITLASTVKSIPQIKTPSFAPFIIIMLILGLNIALNLTDLNGQDHDLNAKDRKLIEYLHQHNITHAYADYWAANLLTYMDQDQQLKVRPINIVDNKMQYLYLQSSIQWTNEGWPLEGSPVVDNNPVIITYTPQDPVYNWTQEINKKYPPVETLTYPWYQAPSFQPTTIVIYKYNTTLPAWPVESLDEFQNRGVKPV